MSGTIANVATQVGTLGLYYYMYKYQNMAIFQTLYEKHSMVKMVDKFSAAIDTTTWIIDYKSIGLYSTNFLLSVVNYKAPNVNTGLTTI